MPNALAQETSPYLRQHQHNPVDWLPWGETALARARELDRPLLVSIGYSACHWCHVMERESFEDPDVAALMNASFVCVKVDREERPDIDGIYMEAVQSLTGHGGWPLNVFLTPDQEPFYGGTYFPPAPRHGLPSWPQVLAALAATWRDRREDAVGAARQIAARLVGAATLDPSTDPIDPQLLDEAVANLARSYDPTHGGFGGAPKFPPASAIEFLLRRGETEMSLGTLRAMASGGINDQVGGGFSRYSVDPTWTVPHFEKMLYDNALLARAYLHGWQRSGGDDVLLRTCRETLDFCLRELRAPEGGFYAALDADSDGVEGRFYVWTLAELSEVLGDLAGPAIAYFGATPGGNFDGAANVLEARGPEPADRDEIRARLLEARGARVRPGLDDKRLTAWNALMIAALAEAGAVLEEPRYVAAAVACAEFVLRELRDGDDDGRLLRSFNDGAAKLGAYLEDHAFLMEALIVLYEATFDERFFVEARTLAETILTRFADDDARGGFFTTASDHERLIARRKDLDDSPIPSGSSSAAFGLLRLAALTGEARYEEAALGALRLVHPIAGRHPQAFGHLLQALDFHLGPVREVALVGADLDALARVVRAQPRPQLVLAGARGSTDGTSVPLLEGRGSVDGQAAAYVCERFTCRAPVTTPAALAALLGD